MQIPYALSTVLDPRFKSVCYSHASEAQWLKSQVCSALEKSLPLKADMDSRITASTPTTDSDVWSVFGALASTSTVSTASRRPLLELEDCLHSPLRPRAENPYLWWRTSGKDTFPQLAKVAQLYTGIPATQVSS